MSTVKRAASGISSNAGSALGIIRAPGAPPKASAKTPTQLRHDRGFKGIETKQGKQGKSSLPPNTSVQNLRHDSATMAPSSSGPAASASVARLSGPGRLEQPAIAGNPMSLLANVATVVSTYSNQTTAPAVSAPPSPPLPSSQPSPGIHVKDTAKSEKPMLQQQQQQQQQPRQQQRQLAPLLPRPVSQEHFTSSPISSSGKGNQGKQDEKSKEESRRGAGPPKYVCDTTALDVVVTIDRKLDDRYPGNDLLRRVVLMNLHRYLACAT
jgi:hypothetical protein